MPAFTRIPLALFALFLWTASAAPAAAEEAPEGPYFIVTSQTEGPDPLPLESTAANIDIAGVIAHVRVTQVYRNRGSAPLEAVYVFPGSTRAAVSGMQMTVGDRTIVADIAKKDVARQRYEAAKEDGKTASLLEQHRANVFQMSVANVMPGDRVEVVLEYTELVVPTDGVYELVYPAVVGPRYTGEQTEAETWHQNPYLNEGEAEPYGFAIKARIAAGMGIHQLESPSHDIKPQFASASEARVEVGGKGAGTKDFVLRYQLRGGAIETGLLRFAGADENFFLMMVQPPRQVARDAMPAREYVFIVDVSGSMAGFPLEVSKKVMRKLLADLRPQDRFNILFFEAGSYALAPRSIEATPQNVARAMEVVDQRRGGGGTNLLAALRKALSMKAAAGMSRTFIAVTDGYVSVEAEAARLVRESLGHANFFAFGIGSSVNRELIERLARAGMGEPFVVLDQAQSDRETRRFHKMIATPALTDIRVRFDDFEAYDVEPLAPPDLLAERPLLVFGKYKGGGEGVITVTGRTGRGQFKKRLATGSAKAMPANRALRALWARHRIASLTDLEGFGEPMQDRIEDLGLRYSLMTRYTSFVAVDKVRRNPGGKGDTVRQAQPLPQGVSNAAVGSGATQVTHDYNGVLKQGAPVVETDELTRVTYDTVGETISLEGTAVAYVADEDLRSGSFTARTVDEGALVLDLDLSLSVREGPNAFAAPTLLRYGLTDRFEARLSSAFSLVDGDASTPDIGFGLKWQLFDLWSLNSTLSVLLDGLRDFDGENPLEWRVRGLALADTYVPGGLRLRTNLGAQLVTLDELEDRAAFVFGSEISYGSLARLTPFAGVSGAVGNELTDVGIDLGVSVRVLNSLRAGIGTRVGLAEDTDDFNAGLFVRWGL